MGRKILLPAMLLVLCMTVTGCFKLTISGTVTDGTNPIKGAVVVRVGADAESAVTVVAALTGLGSTVSAEQVEAIVKDAVESTSVDVTETDSDGNYEFTNAELGPHVVAAIAPPDNMIPDHVLIAAPSIFKWSSTGNNLELE